MDDIVSSKFQLLRAYLEGQIERRPAVIMITSTHEHDGRGFTAHGLANSFKSVGHRTALLDGDGPAAPANGLRDGSRNGVPELFHVKMSFSEAESSSYDAIAALLGRLRDMFAFVVVDAPPLLRYPSVMVLAGAVDAVLLTARQGRAAIPEDELVVRMLHLAKAKVVGVVAVGSENIGEFDRTAVIEAERVAARSAPKMRVKNAAGSRVANFLSMLRRS
jgi:receptor protein-tyrosine kinase